MTRKDIHELDSLWALTVKEKAKYKCEHCGLYNSRMEAAHVVGRRYRATRWGCFLEAKPEYDLCGHCFCHVCHQHYDEHGPRERKIIQLTIGVMRKALIQKRAEWKVAKGQVFEEIKERLDIERAASDDSPYAEDITSGTSGRTD